MRAIAAISIVGIIAVAVVIVMGINRWKSRQAEELEFQRGLKNLYIGQVNVATDALKMIRDLNGDSSFDAQVALDKIEQLREKHYREKEGITE